MAELYNIFYTVSKEYHAQYVSKNQLAVIKPAVDYIHENYTDTLLNISSLPQMCRVTPEYFRKIFKNIYGTSPVKYINNLKITHAKELLESKMFSVTEAALKSGYTDTSHFSREFKKATGITPSEYL